MRIKKKPITVDGWRVSDLFGMLSINPATLPTEVSQAMESGVVRLEHDRVVVDTLEGTMSGGAQWWLIRGVKGEWYPCDAEAFNKSYDIVDATDLGVSTVEFRHPVIDPYAKSPEV